MLFSGTRFDLMEKTLCINFKYIINRQRYGTWEDRKPGVKMENFNIYSHTHDPASYIYHYKKYKQITFLNHLKFVSLVFW